MPQDERPVPLEAVHVGVAQVRIKDAELIFIYGNCPNRDAARTIYVEEAWQEEDKRDSIPK